MNTAQSELQKQIDGHLSELLSSYELTVHNDRKIIRDTVSGFAELYPHEVSLLDSPLLQRLRYIQQTSLASYTYPSASHTRFEHSLGCLLLAQKIISAINKDDHVIPPQDAFAIRIAALLHDVGHGPFSHASECFYESFDEIAAVKNENPDLFKNAASHEILGYFILNSKVFKQHIWDKIIEAYGEKTKALTYITFDHISKMILGKSISKEKMYMSQIINGPFDVDKLDYLQRDGYFSGVQTILDIDRLLITIGVHPDDNGHHLYTDVSGVTVLEQVMFNKMILFSSIYHHHKVRAGLIALTFLFDRIKKSGGSLKIRDVYFDKVVDFLKIDDRDILNNIHSENEINKMVTDIKNRHLLKRALVLGPVTMKSQKNPYFVKLQNNAAEREAVRLALCDNKQDNIYDVYIDCPKPPSFLGGPLEASVKIAKDTYVPLNELYPVSGWVTGYAEYRYRGYVFAKRGMEKDIGAKATEIFKSKGMELNTKAFTMAKNGLPVVPLL